MGVGNWARSKGKRRVYLYASPPIPSSAIQQVSLLSRTCCRKETLQKDKKEKLHARPTRPSRVRSFSALKGISFLSCAGEASATSDRKPVCSPPRSSPRPPGFLPSHLEGRGRGTGEARKQESSPMEIEKGSASSLNAWPANLCTLSSTWSLRSNKGTEGSDRASKTLPPTCPVKRGLVAAGKILQPLPATVTSLCRTSFALPPRLDQPASARRRTECLAEKRVLVQHVSLAQVVRLTRTC